MLRDRVLPGTKRLESKMAVWFTSDWHLFHDNILVLADRPFASIEKMHARIVDEYTSRINEDDTVYILGDVTMCGPKQIQKVRAVFSKFPGHKHLILGNHDRMKLISYLKMGFESVHTSLDIEYSKRHYHLVHEPAEALRSTRVIFGHDHSPF